MRSERLVLAVLISGVMTLVCSAREPGDTSNHPFAKTMVETARHQELLHYAEQDAGNWPTGVNHHAAWKTLAYGGMVAVVLPAAQKH